MRSGHAHAPAWCLPDCRCCHYGLTIVQELATASNDPSPHVTTGTSVYCGSDSRYHQRTVLMPITFKVPPDEPYTVHETLEGVIVGNVPVLAGEPPVGAMTQLEPAPPPALGSGGPPGIVTTAP